MKQKRKLSYLAAVVLSLALGFATFAIAKNESAGSSAKNDKSVKTSQTQKKVKMTKAALKNFEKADKAAGKTNAMVHKEKTQAVIKNLTQVADQEESTGNTEVSEDVEEVAQKQRQVQTRTVEAIEAVEKRGALKTFLLGYDYKNLGQLRSDLVHNRNQIRQLTRTMTQVQNQGDQTMLQEQLATLTQERERIKSIITSNESGFSLFGWVAKFMLGYEPTEINQTEEDQLTEEVEEAINDAPVDTEETTDTTDPAATGTTAP